MSRSAWDFGDELNRFIFHRHEKAQSEFDTAHEEALGEVVADIGRVYGFFTLCVIQGVELLPGPRFQSMSLLISSLESIVSSLHLIRQHGLIDGFALLRVAVESACVAAHIALAPDAFAQYTQQSGQKYTSGRAISFAKHRIHRVSEFWGALSEAAIHPNVTIFGPRRGHDGTPTITIGDRPVTPEQARRSLVLVSIAALILLRASELVLLEQNDEDPNFLRLPGTRWAATAIGARLLKDRFDQLDQLSVAISAKVES